MLNVKSLVRLGRAVSLSVVAANSGPLTEDEAFTAMDKAWEALTDFQHEFPNIMLDYSVRIERDFSDGEREVLFATGCEFFVDEHGIQWVKFKSRNGQAIGLEHMIRTDSPGFTVIRRG